ncbi:hypothetical protein [Pedosphaera parvula]|uniref:TPR repeat-containing protein n=1 Tax=Pedosphaera parvula (strain Ellin514) TaxID=320771 RepID=B9XBQ1_PEDPL|nr:hypothetical protein [Pedosphaera parvula]EEF62936.1 hypothetical protein Cflav_PD5571 [Pedosphaera parvula Ellin514]
MTESDYIKKISYQWPRMRAKSADDLLPLVEEAIRAYPTSAKLHCMRGDLIQLSDGPGYGLEDAAASYEQALKVDANFAEAHESIGYYCDVISHDLQLAEAAFRRAIELGAGVDSYVGLARVLAELGHDTQAILKFLDGCPFRDSAKILEIRSEIEKETWKPKAGPTKK